MVTFALIARVEPDARIDHVLRRHSVGLGHRVLPRCVPGAAGPANFVNRGSGSLSLPRGTMKRRTVGSALKPVVWIELLSCADGLDPLAQAGFVAAGGVLVQDALLDTLVHRGGGGAEGR